MLAFSTTASHNATSVSPPNMSVMLNNARFSPTTLIAQSAPMAALTVGAGRPLEPTFVAATVSTTSSGTPSAVAPIGDVLVATAMAAASESTKEQGKARAWLNKIIPEKLIHYDPSKDPRLLAL